MPMLTVFVQAVQIQGAVLNRKWIDAEGIIEGI